MGSLMLTSDYSFKDKRVVVTGARHGIGRELVKYLHAQGATVYALSRFEEHLRSLKKECPNVITVAANLRNWKDTEEALVESVDEAVDCVINNAEEVVRENLFDMKGDSFDRIFDINVKAVVCVSKFLSKQMIDAGKPGVIINISSLAAKVPTAGAGLLTYCASKAAQDMITRAMAVYLGPYNIRVNSINPTIVVNDFRKDFWIGDEESKQYAENLQALTPLKRFAEIEDVLNACLFLMSDKSSMITGKSLLIDGGYYAR